jgi:hypothetical protein
LSSRFSSGVLNFFIAGVQGRKAALLIELAHLCLSSGAASISCGRRKYINFSHNFSWNGFRAGRLLYLHPIVERPDWNSTNRPRNSPAAAALKECGRARTPSRPSRPACEGSADTSGLTGISVMSFRTIRRPRGAAVTPTSVQCHRNIRGDWTPLQLFSPACRDCRRQFVPC